jgi:hypothetical protein
MPLKTGDIIALEYLIELDNIIQSSNNTELIGSWKNIYDGSN